MVKVIEEVAAEELPLGSPSCLRWLPDTRHGPMVLAESGLDLAPAVRMRTPPARLKECGRNRERPSAPSRRSALLILRRGRPDYHSVHGHSVWNGQRMGRRPAMAEKLVIDHPV